MRTRYDQLKVNEKDILKIAFRTRHMHYDFFFFVVPFHLTNAHEAFMDLMNRVFKDYLDQFVYVFHYWHFGFILNWKGIWASFAHCSTNSLRKEALCQNQELWVLDETSSFFGTYIVSKDGVYWDPRKVEAIQQWPTPTNVWEFRSFLGLTGITWYLWWDCTINQYVVCNK